MLSTYLFHEQYKSNFLCSEVYADTVKKHVFCADDLFATFDPTLHILTNKIFLNYIWCYSVVD